jgi:hypothetical protein
MSTLADESDSGLTVAEYLDALHIAEDENVGLFWTKGDHRQTAVLPRDVAAQFAPTIPKKYNSYLAPNPTSGPPRMNQGRGTEEQVTRVSALYSDLDVKDGACPNIEAALDIMNAISERIEEEPTVVIFSGGGIQPCWSLEECDPAIGIPLLRRFGRLVRAIGEERSIKLDSVFDAARVLRIPGSVNWKYDEPRVATAQLGRGARIDPASLAERLDEWGIFAETDDNRIGLGDVQVPEREWLYADSVCDNARAILKGWRNDAVAARHPWLIRCLVRLECMRRKGCLTQAAYDKARCDLEARFYRLLSTPGNKRDPHRGEVAGACVYAIDVASRKTEAEVSREINGHKPPHLHMTGSRKTNNDAPKGTSNMNGQEESTGAATDSAESAESPRASLAGKFLSRSQLRNLPKPEPLIGDTLDRGTVAELYGKWGTAKSFIALDWGCCVATGKNWQTRKAERAKVLYLAAEGAYGLQSRVDVWEIGWRTLIDDECLTVLPVPVNMLRSGEVAELIEQVHEHGFEFVIIDTLARSMVGGDENSSQDMGEVIDAAYQLLAATPGGRGVVLIVHHTGKDGLTSRGSTALEGGVDTVYRVTGDGFMNVKLDRQKRKDGPKDDLLQLRLGKIALPDDPDGSCVVEAATGLDDAETADRADKVLALFRSHFGATGATGPQLRALAEDELSVSQATAYRAVNDLIDSGKLVNTGSQYRTFLALP